MLLTNRLNGVERVDMAGGRKVSELDGAVLGGRGGVCEVGDELERSSVS